LKIDRLFLKAGDILNWYDHHVRIFNGWVGSQMDIYEATGGGVRREFRPGDELGRVVHHSIAWNERYTPYFPFPQIKEILPATSPVFGARPTFIIRVRGSGALELCEFMFDENCILPKIDRNPARQSMDLTYTPNYDLMPGDHFYLIEAINNVAGQSFKDELYLRFQVV